ncbi:MAG: hydroxysqualene dehydroxylase HpnE [Comamonadaceae bacterium]
MKIAIIGAGWAGLAAAVESTRAGHTTVVFEASQVCGGRARALPGALTDGTPVTLDNGQHILIGAYSESLRLLRLVGVEPEVTLLRLPMMLMFPDGRGLRFPHWPAPLDALAGIVSARGWSLADKWCLLRAAGHWQLDGFQCDAASTVTQLCQRLSPRVMTELIEPLCVSALNTPADQASAQVFLRVLKDALFGVQGGSNLLLPRVDLSTLFPLAAARWLSDRGGQLRLGTRVQSMLPQGSRWQVQGEDFDVAILATSAAGSVRTLENTLPLVNDSLAGKIREWTDVASLLPFQAITTVYAWGNHARLPYPMLALRNHVDTTGQNSGLTPAQFVFDRGQLGGPQGLLAFVVSASNDSREALQAQVIRQAQAQLGLALQAVQTVVEKRATFACRPGLQRPLQQIAPGLLACGDYVAGPYPATLEGAVRSAVAAIKPGVLDVYDAL